MLRRFLFLALSALATVALSCGGGGGQEPTPQPTEPAAGSGPAEQALAKYVQANLQKEFVEDCSKADVGRDAGKICAAFRGERDNLRAYVIGQTFSEFSHWVILEDKGGQWSVAQTSEITGDTAAVPGVPWPLRAGVEVLVADKPCVNVREGPGLNQKAVDCIQEGAKVRLNAGPVAADGFNWWQLEGRAGWIAGEFLRYADALQ